MSEEAEKSSNPLNEFNKLFPDAMVHALPSIPMGVEGECDNPFRYDAFRQGTDLTEDGPYLLMFTCCTRKKEGKWLKSSFVMDDDLIIIDKRSGRRVRINLSKMFPAEGG